MQTLCKTRHVQARLSVQSGTMPFIFIRTTKTKDVIDFTFVDGWIKGWQCASALLETLRHC